MVNEVDNFSKPNRKSTTCRIAMAKKITNEFIFQSLNHGVCLFVLSSKSFGMKANPASALAFARTRFSNTSTAPESSPGSPPLRRAASGLFTRFILIVFIGILLFTTALTIRRSWIPEGLDESAQHLQGSAALPEQAEPSDSSHESSPPHASGRPGSLSLLKHPRAVCLDGSHAGYYYRPAPPDGSPQKWVIVLGDGDGSSDCGDKPSCRARGKTRFGSSRFFDPALDSVTPLPPLISLDCSLSGQFCTWQHVYVPYCSQDMWTGRVSKPSKRTWGRHFAGHEILEALLSALQSASPGGLGDATEVLLVGAGTGGHGIWANADYVSKRLPGARVSGLVLNAYHRPCSSAGQYGGSGRVPVPPSADWGCTALAQRSSLWNSYADQGCVTAVASAPGGGSIGACLLGATAAMHVTTPVFIAQALLDRDSLATHYGMPLSVTASTAGPGGKAPPGALEYLTDWQHGAVASLSSLAKSAPGGRGVFAPACTQSISLDGGGPLVDGKDLLGAFTQWYAHQQGKKGLAAGHVALVDTCASSRGVLACNPSCSRLPGK